MKAKLSTAASKPAPDTVLLRNLDSHGHSKPFEKEHAVRLLAYPGTRWAALEEAGNEPAGAPTTAPAAPSDADTTGQPTSL